MDGDTRLLFFVGSLNSSFIQNELKYTHKAYPNASIFYYDADEDVLIKLQKYRFHFVKLKKVTLIRLINVRFIKIFFSKEIISLISNEFRYILSKGNITGKLFYLFYYIFSYISFLDSYDLEIGKKEKVILYSYWLSNSAFICANLKRIIEKENVAVKFISRAHGYDLYEYRNKYKYLPFRSFIMKNADKIYPISNNGKEYLLEYNFIDSSKVITNRLGVSDDRYLNYIELNSNKIVIASCSSIITIKRLDLIIDFISKLSRKTQLDISWIHIGDGQLINYIVNYAERKLKPNQYCFFGARNNNEVRSILIENKVNFFINLSDSEGIPVSIMEAISLGIPVIARNVGGNNEIVNEKTGYLLNSKMSDLEIAIEFILNQYNNQRLRKSCHEFWNIKYNSSINYEKFYKCL